MKARGLIISADAFLGLTLLFFLLVASLFYVSKVSLNSWNQVDSIYAARDVSVIFEKNGIFKTAVLQESGEIILANLNNTRVSQCFEVSIFSENDLVNPIINTKKAGCVKSTDTINSVERSFVVNDYGTVNFYVARVEAWFV